MVKIADGKRIESAARTQWIGDQTAYSRFREYESRQRPNAEHGRAINGVLFADELSSSPASDLFSAMRNIVADRALSSVGGFVSVVSNRENGFRFSVYSDMLYDWPDGKPQTYRLNLSDDIAFTATDENASFAVPQVSSGFMGMNMVAFYFTRARKLFFFFGKNNGLANACKVFQDLPAFRIADVLNSFVGLDLRWLLWVTSPSNASEKVDRLKLENPGVQFAISTEANTFPKPQR